MTLWLIRHTAVDVLPGTCYGSLDVSLREPAEPVFSRITANLAGIEKLRTSPATRCRRLADHIACARDLEVVEDPRWRELDFGDWEGLSWNAVPREAGKAWANNYWTIAPPRGETYANLIERVSNALLELTHDCDTVIISHAGPIRAALALCLNWPRERFPAVDIDYGAVIGLRHISRGWERC